MGMDETKRVIHRTSGVAERLEQFGPYQIEALLSDAEEAAATVYRVHVEANQLSATSYHLIAEEFYYVLSGGGTAILDGARYPIRQGDFLRLPPGTRHAFETDDEPLQMLDIHVPGCRPDRDAYFIEDK